MKKKTFYVSYDLRKTIDRKKLIEKLTDLKGRRVLESVWTLQTKDECSVTELKDVLCKYIDKNAGIVVVEAKEHNFYNLDRDPHEID